MSNIDRIAMKIAARPKVLIERVGRKVIRLSWNFLSNSPLDENVMDGFMDKCRAQAQREAVEVAQILGVTLPKLDESYVTGVSKDLLKVIVDVDFGVIPGKPVVWDDVVDGLREGGWL